MNTAVIAGKRSKKRSFTVANNMTLDDCIFCPVCGGEETTRVIAAIYCNSCKKYFGISILTQEGYEEIV